MLENKLIINLVVHIQHSGELKDELTIAFHIGRMSSINHLDEEAKFFMLNLLKIN